MSAKTPNFQYKLLVTYLKDVKPSGTVGGTATAGAYQTRTLNTQEGDTSFCSLSSNQFTLQPGIYEIEASAPTACAGTFTNQHKAKIRNITDSTDAILGSSEYNDANAAGVAISERSVVVGIVTITSAKIFELQHRVSATVATNGFGAPTTFGDNEVYSIVKVTKLN